MTAPPFDVPPTALERRVLDALDAVGAHYEGVLIDPDLADTATFCATYGYALADSANCILVASRDDPPVLAACLNLATTRLDVNRRVRRLLGVRKLSFAPTDLTERRTGMVVGGVTPFGLPEDLPLLVDARVTARDRVIVGGGSRRLKLVVETEAITRLPAAQVVDDLALDPGRPTTDRATPP